MYYSYYDDGGDDDDDDDDDDDKSFLLNGWPKNSWIVSQKRISSGSLTIVTFQHSKDGK